MPEEVRRVRFPRTGVRMVERRYMELGLNTGPMQEQGALLSTKPSQSLNIIIFGVTMASERSTCFCVLSARIKGSATKPVVKFNEVRTSPFFRAVVSDRKAQSVPSRRLTHVTPRGPSSEFFHTSHLGPQ